MTGLRERKKTDRKFRIQSAAVKLFGSIGYEATTMEKIAQEADLGVGTLYNYYKSKGDILLSIIADRADGFIADFENAIKNHSSDVLIAINSFFDIYFKSFSIYNKLIWRELISNALAKQPSMIEYISQIDSVFINNFKELLLCLQKEGKLNNNVDIGNAVLTLYSLIIFHIIRFISDESMTMESLKDSLNNQVKVVMTGLQ